MFSQGKISLQIPYFHLILRKFVVVVFFNLFKVALKCRNDCSLDCALCIELAGTDKTTCINAFANDLTQLIMHPIQ